MTMTLGSWITLNHISIVEIMADAGFDWLCVDLEHSVIDYYGAEKLIATIEAKGCVPYVRVGANDPLIIKRVLDAGAKGIIVPMINSKIDAEKAINAVKYPPLGNRGVGLARAQGYGFDFEEYADTINNETRVIAQIEHIDAINNLEDIITVDGIDGTIIGPYDLSGSMGKPGKYEDSDVVDVLRKYEEVSKKVDKPMGYHIIEPNHKLVLEKIKNGYTFIAFSLDILFLGTICRQEMNSLRNGIG
ncbi:2,4-dihydroxyhept-2-ene-1,7-dioic acid aldolase [Candidatus Woesearchaeota archaeon]|nr:2,4-dihydroxyhept-2-ene-1,7-dioic acid aldolase [Candidatus Woesearchaeota archaeon]